MFFSKIICLTVCMAFFVASDDANGQCQFFKRLKERRQNSSCRSVCSTGCPPTVSAVGAGCCVPAPAPCCAPAPAPCCAPEPATYSAPVYANPDVYGPLSNRVFKVEERVLGIEKFLKNQGFSPVVTP